MAKYHINTIRQIHVPSILRHNIELGHITTPEILKIIRLAHSENSKSNLGTKVSVGSDPITLCDFEHIRDSAPPGSKNYLEDISYIIFCLLCGARNITMRNITVNDIVQVTPLSGNKIAVTIREKYRKNKLGDCVAELTFIGDTVAAHNPLDFFFYFNQHLIKTFRLDLLEFDEWKDASNLDKAFIWPITSESFTARLKQYFIKAGLNADDISGHGLRHGYVVSGLLECRLSGMLQLIFIKLHYNYIIVSSFTFLINIFGCCFIIIIIIIIRKAVFRFFRDSETNWRLGIR